MINIEGDVYFYKKNRKIGAVEKNYIMYVNCHGRQIELHTPIMTLEHNGTLRDTRMRLEDEYFVQINKSDLVNLRFVVFTDLSSVTMRDGMTFPVTSSYQAEFLSKMRNKFVKADAALHYF